MKLEKEIEQAEKLLATLKQVKEHYEWIDNYTKKTASPYTYPYTYPHIVWNDRGTSVTGTITTNAPHVSSH